MNNKQVSIETAGKEKISAYFYGEENRDTAVIFCHGFTGSSSGLYKPKLAEALADKYLVCRFDFRGHGDSEGKFYDSSITRELEDLDTVVKYLKKQYSPKKLILIGMSFGSAIVLLYSVDHDVDGLISLSGGGDLEKSVTYEFTDKQLKDFEEKGETLVENWSKEGNDDLLGKQFLDDMRKYSTTDAAKKLRCPVLFIHGTNDTTIPHRATEEIYDLVQSDKEIQLMEDTDHNYNFFKDNPKIDELLSYMKDWLNRYF